MKHISINAFHQTSRWRKWTIALLLYFTFASSYAFDFEEKGIFYTIISSNEVSVTSKDGIPFESSYSGDVTIPEHVSFNGLTYKIVSIGEYAFAESEITSIELPTSLITIDKCAFYCCEKLSRIEIPNSVVTIGDKSFSCCANLTSVCIGSGLENIGVCPFTECVKLERILVDKNNDTFDSRDDCNAIIKTNNNKLIIGCKTSVIPLGVTAIGSQAFMSCSELLSIYIPNSVVSIGEYAFDGCI